MPSYAPARRSGGSLRGTVVHSGGTERTRCVRLLLDRVGRLTGHAVPGGFQNGHREMSGRARTKRHHDWRIKDGKYATVSDP
jgi:hypothetical protein